jgi:tetratricopeptide (TPR) repeat protein
MHECGISRWIYVVYHECGNLEHAKKNPTAALEHYRHALNLARTLGLKQELVQVVYNMGNMWLALGQHNEARQAFDYVISTVQRTLATTPSATQHMYAVMVLYFSWVGQYKIAAYANDETEMKRCKHEAEELLQAHDFLARYKDLLA